MSASLGNVLVTGATGLLGAELVGQLLAAGEAESIVCLVRDGQPRSRFHAEGLGERVITVHGDVRDERLLRRVIAEYRTDTVFHLAAQTQVGVASDCPAETFDVNIRGTWTLLEACRTSARPVHTVIVASSDKAYGRTKAGPYRETTPLEGQFPYDVSKACADLIAQAFARSYGLSVCITRCGNFFGPGDLNFERLIPGTIRSLLLAEPPVIRSDGKFVRDYIFVADAAKAYRALAERMMKGDLKGEAFNFSYGTGLSVLEVVKAITAIVGSPLAPIVRNTATNEIDIQVLDNRKAREVLGWKPDYGWERGLEDTVEWYRRRELRGPVVK